MPIRTFFSLAGGYGNTQSNENMFYENLDWEKQNAIDTRNFTKKENELAYLREFQMWNMQNEYNSPSEQMKRYQDAGLNPNLIYGQGTPGNATDMPKYTPTKGERVNTPNLPYRDTRMDIAGGILSTTQQLSNLKLNSASERVALATERKINSETEKNIIDNSTLYAKNMLALKYQMLESQLKDGQITEQQAKNQYAQFENKLFEQTFDTQVEMKNQELLNMKSSQDNTEASTEYIDMQTKNIQFDLSVKEALKTTTINQQKELLKQYEKNVASISSQDKLNQKNLELLNERLTIEQKRNLVESLNLESEKELYEVLKTNPKYINSIYQMIKEIMSN